MHIPLTSRLEYLFTLGMFLCHRFSGLRPFTAKCSSAHKDSGIQIWCEGMPERGSVSLRADAGRHESIFRTSWVESMVGTSYPAHLGERTQGMCRQWWVPEAIMPKTIVNQENWLIGERCNISNGSGGERRHWEHSSGYKTVRMAYVWNLEGVI